MEFTVLYAALARTCNQHHVLGPHARYADGLPPVIEDAVDERNQRRVLPLSLFLRYALELRNLTGTRLAGCNSLAQGRHAADFRDLEGLVGQGVNLAGTSPVLRANLRGFDCAVRALDGPKP